MTDHVSVSHRGTLMKGIGGFYTVLSEEGDTHVLRCMKKIRRLGISPLPGDNVRFIPGAGEEHGWITDILPRKSVCLRPPVANISMLVIVIAPVPAPNLLLADKLISRSLAQGIKAVIAVNKTDLDQDFAPYIIDEYRASGLEIFPVSAVRRDGLQLLRRCMTDELCCFAGQSGVGKSTLLNSTLDLDLETGEISKKIMRGKNTTRQTELFIKDGIRVMDTAGFNLLENERELPPEELKKRYPEFRQFEGKCRFRECLHDSEPGCAVSLAAEEGIISHGRVERYRILLEEARNEWRDRYD